MYCNSHRKLRILLCLFLQVLPCVYGMIDCGVVCIWHADHMTGLPDLVGELVVAVTVGGEVLTRVGRVLAVAVRNVGGQLHCWLYVCRYALTGRAFVSHPLHRHLIEIQL
jgi:hypothetical protein